MVEQDVHRVPPGKKCNQARLAAEFQLWSAIGITIEFITGTDNTRIVDTYFKKLL